MQYVYTFMCLMCTAASVPGMLEGSTPAIITGLYCAACTGFVASFAFTRLSNGNVS